jgi:hypothetical protein
MCAGHMFLFESDFYKEGGTHPFAFAFAFARFSMSLAVSTGRYYSQLQLEPVEGLRSRAVSQVASIFLCF